MTMIEGPKLSNGDFSVGKNSAVGEKITILLVDDSSAFIEATMKLLARYPRIQVLDIAFGAEDALWAIAKHQPEVVLLDIEMPGKSGLDMVQEIKTAAPGVKVVILTLFDNPGYRRAANLNGADAFIPKGKFVGELLPVILRLVDGDQPLEDS
jgi:two-component system response regulator DesR